MSDTKNWRNNPQEWVRVSGNLLSATIETRRGLEEHIGEAGLKRLVAACAKHVSVKDVQNNHPVLGIDWPAVFSEFDGAAPTVGEGRA